MPVSEKTQNIVNALYNREVGRNVQPYEGKLEATGLQARLNKMGKIDVAQEELANMQATASQGCPCALQQSVDEMTGTVSFECPCPMTAQETAPVTMMMQTE